MFRLVSPSAMHFKKLTYNVSEKYFFQPENSKPDILKTTNGIA